MDALIYTSNDQEYQVLEEILAEEAGVVNVHRGDPDTDRQYHYPYDLVIAACEDEKSLRQIRRWKEASDIVQIIWITEDAQNLKNAFKYFVFDCFTRPYDEARVRLAIRHVIPRCPRRHCWTFGPGTDQRHSSVILTEAQRS